MPSPNAGLVGRLPLLFLAASLLAGCANIGVPPPPPRYDEQFWRDVTQGLKQVEKEKQK